MNPRTYESGPLSILIVDDDPIMLRLLEAMLCVDRHNVKVAEDVTAALEKFQSQHWDVVLTDFYMPGGDGADLADAIKKISPHTPIVMMSGFAAGTTCPGVDHFIQKPFRRAGIASAINSALKATQDRAAAAGAEPAPAPEPAKAPVSGFTANLEVRPVLPRLVR